MTGKYCESCSGCSYYELTVIHIFPFEYCYKHNKTNKKPSDFEVCDFHTTSKWIRFKTTVKSFIGVINV